MTTATLTQKATALGAPRIPADTPEKPGDLRTVEQVDWVAAVDAVLDKARGSHIDLPLPQLLLRLGSVISELTGNAEHLKGFVGGTAADQEDLAGSVTAALKRNAKKISDQATEMERLKVRLEHLEGLLSAPADLAGVDATVQR